MRFHSPRSQVQPIGLDIGHDSVKMLQLEVRGERVSVVAAARVPIPHEARADSSLRLAAATDAVRQVLRQGRFVGRRVVAALPREAVHLKNLRLPLMPLAELEQAVTFEAQNLFPFPADEASVRVIPAGEVRQGADVRQEAIVLAVRHADVNDYLERLHRCDAVVESLDVEPCALYRGVERFVRRRDDEQEVHVLVDVGWRKTQVVIGRGRDVNFIKSIEIGGRQLVEAVSRKLGISADEAEALRRRLSAEPGVEDRPRRDPVRQAVIDATRMTVEDLGREVSLCLRYYSVTFRGHRPSQVRLVGGQASHDQVVALLAGVLPIPVSPGRPLASVDASGMRAGDASETGGEWAVAFGLGLRLANGYFAKLDGKPRETGLFAPAGGAVGAEVIDTDRIATLADELPTAAVAADVGPPKEAVSA